MFTASEIAFSEGTDSYGFVYILTNPRMASLLKIGQTERHPAIRAAELSSHTGVPAPFEVAFYTDVTERLSAEQAIHSALANHRVDSDREFFELSVGSAIRFIANAVHEFVPSVSPFKSYLESFSLGLCPECLNPMDVEDFKVHWSCSKCGHRE